jgi:putative ABC transport system substrate-binding protein
MAGYALTTRRGWSQEAGRVYRLGNLFSAPRNAPQHVALRERLAQKGFIEGQNLWIDGAGYGLASRQFEEHAAELVKARVDVIVAGGDAAVLAAQRATIQIPILALTDDMLGQGFVHSLARPDRNITGVAILASELDSKRQEILIEAAPSARRIAALVDSTITSPRHLRKLEDEARARGIALSMHQVAGPADIPAALDAAAEAGAGAINVLASALFFNNRKMIFDRISTHRLPAIYQWPEMAHEGGLIGYGPSIVQLYRDVQSRQLLRLLSGAKPADLPVEQPTTFVLVVNLKTAKAFRLTVPSSLLARADEVIE